MASPKLSKRIELGEVVVNQTGKRTNGYRCVLAVLSFALGLVIFGTMPALAFETHLLEHGFGPDGTSNTNFNRPTTVGVDQATGDVFVGDGFPGCLGCTGNTVQRFKGGTLKLEPFEISTFSIYRAAQFAVNPTTHVLYVEEGQASVKAYQPDLEPAEFTAIKASELSVAEVCGVAIDPNGDIYVAEFNDGIGVYAPTGELITTIPQSGVCNLAIDSEGAVYAITPVSPEAGVAGPVQKFVPSTFPVTSMTGYTSEGIVDANPSYTLALNPISDQLYIDEGNQIAVYSKSDARLGAFGSGVLASDGRQGMGLAVDTSGAEKLYAAQSNFGGQVEVFGPAVLLPDVTTGAATEVSPKGSATVHGAVNPDGVLVSNCQFDYGPTEAYGKTVNCKESPGEGTNPVEVTAQLSTLEPGVTYHYRLEATNESAPTGVVNRGEDQTFATPPRPSIEAAAIKNLTNNFGDVSGDLTAEVVPNVPVSGVAASCLFEYGSTASYEHSLDCEPATLEGSKALIVSRNVEGLHLNTTYHWRVMVTNEAGTTIGADHTFIYSTLGEGLPDNRAYEMVTPSEKNAALLSDFHFGIPHDISEDGARLIVSSVQCFAQAESCVVSRGNEVGIPFLFSRGSEGWDTIGLTPPASSFEVNTPLAVSADTGDALLSIPTPPMGEDDFYIRDRGGSLVDIGPASPPSQGAVGPIGMRIATNDFSRVIYEAPGIWPVNQGTGITAYEYPNKYPNGGSKEPALVGVSGGPGSTALISRCKTTVGTSQAGAGEVEPGMLSADGETVYFTASTCEGGTEQNTSHAVPVDELFARVGEAQTVALSEPSVFSLAAPYTACKSASCIENVNEQANWKSAAFAGASTDGSRIFFDSEQQLTDDAVQGQDNLYEAELGVSLSSRQAFVKRLTDASAGDTSGHESRLQGVVAISGDGSHVYFVAQGILTGVVNSQGETAQDGADNLYCYEGSRGRVSFIGRLAENDASEWNEQRLIGLRANVTPDGRFLVFESHARLTADDTRTDGSRQIFRYDALTGTMTRLSIGDLGWNDNGNEGIGDASIVIALDGSLHAGTSRNDPSMSNDGSFVFFESPIGLTPYAVNDVQIGSVEEGGRDRPLFAENIYEWHDGRVFLISDGKDIAKNRNASAVRLLGSDGSGSNVFFTSADPLVSSDTDTQVDYYDARLCTHESPCVSAAPPSLTRCMEEACHGVPSARPVEPTGGSATLSGTGNVIANSVAGKAGRKAHRHRHKRKHRRKAKRSNRCAQRGARSCAGRLRNMPTALERRRMGGYR